MTWVFNREDDVFKEGDTVYITNTLLASETCYPVQVTKVLSSEESGGLGIHYALLVVTHIDDYMTIREAKRVFKSVDQYEERRREAIKNDQKFRRELRNAQAATLDAISRHVAGGV